MRAASALAVLLALVLGGCGYVDQLRPTAVAADRWRLAAVVDDALNLPVGAPVKAGGVVVGKVVAVEPEDYRARVEMAIDDDVRWGERSRFRLRYTTALGEMYVDVEPATGGRALADGDVVRGPAVTTSATVEDTLASASLLVNGGSLGQVQTIVSELNTALDGRVGATRGLLSETDAFLAEALRSTRQIDRVLRALSRASQTLDQRQATIDAALRDLRPAARTMTRNTDDLARLLRRTDRLAVVSDRLVTRTRDDLTTVVDELGPVLEELLGIREQLVPGLDLLSDFAAKADDRAPTDYLNLKVRLHPPAGTAPDGDDGGDGGLPGLPGLPGLLGGLPGGNDLLRRLGLDTDPEAER